MKELKGKKEEGCLSSVVVVFAISALIFGVCIPFISTQRRGQYRLVLTNTTEHAISMINVGVGKSNVAVSFLAPYMATDLMFIVSADTSYRLSYSLSDHAILSTNVGYLTSGIKACDVIAIKEEDGVSYTHTWDKEAE